MGKLAAFCILLFKLAAFCIVLFKLTEAFSAAHHHQHPLNTNHPEGCLPEFEDASVQELSDPRSDKYTYYPPRNWDYDTTQGPLFWNRRWPQCHNSEQSPINIKANNERVTPSKLCNIWPADAPTNFWLRNAMCDAHTITLRPATPMKVEIYSSVFKLVNIHFHTPSEHRYLDEHYPLEAHFVLRNQKAGGTPTMMVRGIFFDVSDVATDESDFLSAFAADLASVTIPGDKVFVSNIVTKGIMQIFENACISGKVAHYDGSLTTPPCDGSISWHVLSQPQHVSARTYNKLKRIMKFNSRYTQSYPNRNNILQKACTRVSPANVGNVQMDGDGGFEL